MSVRGGGKKKNETKRRNKSSRKQNWKTDKPRVREKVARKKQKINIERTHNSTAAETRRKEERIKRFEETGKEFSAR